MGAPLGRYEDELYAIPYQLQTMLLYYNKTLFEDKSMQPPRNRDELEAMAEELQGQGVTPFAAGIGDDPAAIEWFPTVFWNHYSGPDALYQALTGEIPFSDPVFVDAIELFNTRFQMVFRVLYVYPLRNGERRERRPLAEHPGSCSGYRFGSRDVWDPLPRRGLVLREREARATSCRLRGQLALVGLHRPALS